MPVAYTTTRTTKPEPYLPSELFADVGEDNASGFTADQVWYSLHGTAFPTPQPLRPEYLSSHGGES